MVKNGKNGYSRRVGDVEYEVGEPSNDRAPHVSVDDRAGFRVLSNECQPFLQG
jgi:hypothetical protein